MRELLIFDRERLFQPSFQILTSQPSDKIYNELEKILTENLNKDIIVKIWENKEEKQEKTNGYIYLIGEELPLSLYKDSSLFFIFREISLLTFSDTLEVLKKKFNLNRELYLVSLKKFNKKDLVEYFIKVAKAIKLFEAEKDIVIEITELGNIDNQESEITNDNVLKINNENLKEISPYTGGIIDLTYLKKVNEIKIHIEGDKADFTFVPNLYNLFKGILWIKKNIYTDFLIKDNLDNPKLHFSLIANTVFDFWENLMHSLKIISFIQNKNFDYRIYNNNNQIIVEGKVY